jgi:hypothetical protein
VQYTFGLFLSVAAQFGEAPENLFISAGFAIPGIVYCGER